MPASLIQLVTKKLALKSIAIELLFLDWDEHTIRQLWQEENYTSEPLKLQLVQIRTRKRQLTMQIQDLELDQRNIFEGI